MTTPAARGGLAVCISGPTTCNYLPTSNTSKQTSVPKGTSRAEGGWVVGCQGSASRASTGAVLRIHDKRIPPFSCPRSQLTCRIPCVSGLAVYCLGLKQTLSPAYRPRAPSANVDQRLAIRSADTPYFADMSGMQMLKTSCKDVCLQHKGIPKSIPNFWTVQDLLG